MKICFSLLLLFGLIASNWAKPQFRPPPAPSNNVPNLNWSSGNQGSRGWRPDLNISGGGGGRSGVDLNVRGSAPVWQSRSGQHSIGANGQYSQHLGGAQGSGRPNFGGGASYTFKF